jgi:hypothetical protein
MEYNIESLLSNINRADNISIHYDKPINVSDNFIKMNVYNPQVHIPLHNFWFYVDCATVVDVSKSKVYLKIALSENKNSDLIKYIDVLDNKLGEYAQQKFSNNYKFTQSIEKNDIFPPTIKIKIINESVLFNSNGDILKHLSKSDQIMFYFKLDNLWINKKTNKTYLSWSMLQLKKIQTINLKQSFFNTNQNSNPIQRQLSNSTNNSIVNKSHSIAQNKQSLQSIPSMVAIPTKFAPSMSDILGQLTRLKKPKPKDDENNNYEFETIMSQVTNEDYQDQDQDQENLENESISEPDSDSFNSSHGNDNDSITNDNKTNYEEVLANIMKDSNKLKKCLMSTEDKYKNINL